MSEKKIDISKTLKVKTLLDIPKNQRDNAWIRSFFDNIGQCSLLPHPSKRIVGPDSFGYVALTFPTLDQATEGTSIEHLSDYCSRNGVGIVICENEKPNSHPIWVFSYGDIWSFHYYKSFWGDPQDLKEIESAVSNSENESEISEKFVEITGPLAEKFFPAPVQKAVRKFFSQVGLENVSFSIVQDEKAVPTRSLVLDITAEEFRDSESLEQVIYFLQWYLPRHRSVMLRPSDSKIRNWAPLAA